MRQAFQKGGMDISKGEELIKHSVFWWVGGSVDIRNGYPSCALEKCEHFVIIKSGL